MQNVIAMQKCWTDGVKTTKWRHLTDALSSAHNRSSNSLWPDRKMITVHQSAVFLCAFTFFISMWNWSIHNRWSWSLVRCCRKCKLPVVPVSRPMLDKSAGICFLFSFYRINRSLHLYYCNADWCKLGIHNTRFVKLGRLTPKAIIYNVWITICKHIIDVLRN